MVKIALDTHMYHASMSVADQLRKTADLGYEYVELSPRADWFFWHRYPKADDALIAETRKAIAETGASSMQEMGRVMGKVMGTAKGQIDGSLVQAKVRARLGG